MHSVLAVHPLAFCNVRILHFKERVTLDLARNMSRRICVRAKTTAQLGIATRAVLIDA